MKRKYNSVYKLPDKLNDKGTVALAAAIIKSGIVTNDESFIESDWYNILNKMIQLKTIKQNNEVEYNGIKYV